MIIKKDLALYIIASFLGIIVTLIVLSHQQTVNVDGVLYLETAKAYLARGVHGAMDIYDKPVYSIIIAIVHQITSLSLMQSAFFINTIFYILMLVGFIRLLRALGASYLMQWIGVLMLLTLPTLTHLRDSIVRGHAYYAILLWAFVFLIQYFRKPHFFSALLWGITSCLAALFRIEGAAFIAVLPLVYFFKPRVCFTRKSVVVFLAYLLPLSYMIFAIIHAHLKGYLNLQHIGHVSDVFAQLKSYNTWRLQFNEISRELVTLLGPSSKHNTQTILALGLIGLALKTFIFVLTPLYVGLSVYAIAGRLTKGDWSAKAVLFTAIGCNVIIVMLFTLQTFFISQRYWLMTAILLMLFVPFGLYDIFHRWKSRIGFVGKYRLIFPFVCLIILYTTIQSLGYFGPSKSYIIDAAKWFGDHASKNARVYTNEPRILAYIEQPGTKYPQDFLNGDRTLLAIDKQDLSQFDYIIINLKRNNADTIQKLIMKFQRKPIKVFKNKRDAKLLVFKIT